MHGLSPLWRELWLAWNHYWLRNTNVLAPAPMLLKHVRRIANAECR